MNSNTPTESVLSVRCMLQETLCGLAGENVQMLKASVYIHCRLPTSSYPDGGCKKHMGVAHSYCYKFLARQYSVTQITFLTSMVKLNLY